MFDQLRQQIRRRTNGSDRGNSRYLNLKSIMAALVAAIHIPESNDVLHRLWKMDHRDKPGDDEILLREKKGSITWFPFPRIAEAMLAGDDKR